VTISPFDGVIMKKITDSSYNFTGLTPDNSYTVTVVGRNRAGVGESRMMTTVAGDFDKLIHICMLALMDSSYSIRYSYCTPLSLQLVAKISHYLAYKIYS